VTTALAILAGGESSRMGQPKAALRVGETPILQFILDRLHWPGETILVTAPGHEHPCGWQSFDREVVDPLPGAGPMRGLLTVLEQTTNDDAVVATTCDMPLVTREMVDHLIAALDGETQLVMTQVESRIEPFPIALRPAIRQALQSQFDAGQRSIRKLAQLPQTKLVRAPPAWPKSVWTNLNSPEDYRRFLDDQSSP
jgi:molybdopterin-guanine dinucleotide biosynthesis protein A